MKSHLGRARGNPGPFATTTTIEALQLLLRVRSTNPQNPFYSRLCDRHDPADPKSRMAIQRSATGCRRCSVVRSVRERSEQRETIQHFCLDGVMR